MNRYLSSSIIFVLAVALSFLSCDGRSETSLPKESTSPVFMHVTNNTSILKNSSNNNQGQPAPNPIIIRSQVPTGSYFYKPDTLQVSQYIRRIFQDTKGNLWFGTVGDGVCRYDGRYLTYYTTREGFSGNNLQGIAEDKDGNLWFATTGGVSKYDDTAKSSSFTNFTTKEGLSDNSA
ncbi:MAG: two-component regulator propeller domain-containing protein, partial [Bacteroidia bacterium]